MSLSYKPARWLATASFLFDFAAQQYGMFSTPNMKTVHDQNLSFFSPQPFFIAAFFFPQQLLQLAWLYRLWKLKPTKNETENKEMETIVKFVPYYALGNVCIGVWMFFWNASALKSANVFVCINTFAQLYFMATQLDHMNLASTSSILTHIVSKTFAGIGVLDILHNTSAAYFKDQPAPELVRVFTGIGFGLGGAASDWIFGGCLVYDLIALAVGQAAIAQSGSWGTLLGAYAVGAAAIVAAKNVLRPPYIPKNTSYEPIDADDNH